MQPTTKITEILLTGLVLSVTTILISIETGDFMVGAIHSHYTRECVLQEKGQNLDHIEGIIRFVFDMTRGIKTFAQTVSANC